jgi:hypothetical protein
MGKNNKARRAAKARQRSRRGTPRNRGETRRGDEFADFLADPSFQIAAEWFEVCRAVRSGSSDAADLAARLARHPASMVDAEVEQMILGLIDDLWSAGWQPAELRRQVRIARTAAAARLTQVAILADLDRRTGQRIDHRWRAQAGEFALHTISLHGGWLAGWRRHEGIGRVDCILVAATVVTEWSGLPVLDVLIPPPGAPASAAGHGMSASTGAAADPILSRVRKLLVKAESTDFEDEAISLTEKAQELMTRHAIDEAMLSDPQAGDVPRMIRLPVDAPYADAKSVLLSTIATANRCRAVSLDRLQMGTVVGHAGDLSVVELLFTSLLVQAQKALAEAGRAGGFGARARSKSFRSSFFLAYAHRIGERLRGVNDAIIETAEERDSFLPVLRAREHAVEEFLAERFGNTLVESPVRGGHDLAGSAYGRRAADDAQLDSGELLW